MALIEILLEEFQATLTETKDLTPRNFHFPEVKHMIKAAIGIRRCGKTYFLYQYIHSLLEQGIPLSTILYINFEDDRLLPMTQKEMAALLESFYTLYPENHHQTCYLFLDEIQTVEGWELVVRRFFDSKKVQIYLTGSSSKLLSKEIASSLRGRSLAIEIWPYDFTEFLRARAIEPPEKPIGKISLDIYGKYFLDFLSLGGFPAVQSLAQNLHRTTLQDYVETVIFRDVIERYKVANIALLKYLTHSLLKNFAAIFSVNKFFNDIKSQGYQAAKDTIFNYINYLEDAYLIGVVPIFTESLRRAQISPKKIYIVDNGLIQANVMSNLENYGRLLENQVYLDLRRQNKKIYYYQTQSGHEIDFVTVAPDGKKELLQIVWDMSDKATRLREERALEEAGLELNIPGRIIDKEMYLKAFASD